MSDLAHVTAARTTPDLRPNTVKAVLALLLMLVAALGASWLKPDRRLAETLPGIDIQRAVPEAFGDWKQVDSGVVMVRSAEAEETLHTIYNQILSRTYKNSQGDTVMLSMAYGSEQSQQMRAHRQEVCYSAQGFKIADLHNLTLQVHGQDVPGTRLTASVPGRQEPVTYWFTMGDTVVRSYLDRQWHLLRYALSGYVPDGYLYRVSSISDDTERAYALHLEFSNALMAAMDPALAARLVGAAK